jgi:hypothetical protein
LREAANRAAVKLGYLDGLKKEQLEVVVAFLSGQDVFAVLPTGFGKSLCYGCLPFAFEHLGEAERGPIVVVVTPLLTPFSTSCTSLIASQSVSKRHFNDIHAFSRILAKRTSRSIMCHQTLPPAATPD